MLQKQNSTNPIVFDETQSIDFRQMFSSLSVMFYVMKLVPELETEYVSPAFKSLGFPLEDFYTNPNLIYELMHPEDLLMMREANKAVYAQEQLETSYEYRIYTKDGEVRWWKDHGQPILNEHGESVKWVGVISDITDKKSAGQTLLDYAANLERSNREVVAAREEIEKANKKLVQSNRELEDFAYVASHDLQEPLRKVQAFGDRLEKKYAEKLGAEGSDYIERMRNAAGRMQTLINDLLTFSRVSTKCHPFETIDIKKIAEDVVSDLEVKIEETKAKVEIGNLPVIDADPLQMRQLFQNLIGNALKFQRPGETPHIKISSDISNETSAGFQLNGVDYSTHDAGKKVCNIVIQDNGIGFEEKYLHKIFTVFQRLHGRGTYEGSGIGLSVCRKIVERHNGEITAHSQPEKGSTFLVTLPLKQIPQEKINDEI